jgi:hypothetical protein
MNNLGKAALFAWLIAVPLLAGDADGWTAGRPSFGFRINYFPTRFFDTGTATASTTVPAANYTYTANTDSEKFAVGPSVEYQWSRHFAVELELHFHHVEYQQITKMASGRADPSSSTDNRNIVTTQQTSQVNYWELPLLAHYYGLGSKGWWARTYLTGGLEYRHVGKVRTGTEFWYPDGTTDYNETPPAPSLANQFGAVAGAGLRLRVFKVNVTPELRFVRWRGLTFQGTAYRSTRDQFEAGIGFSF